MSGERLMKRLLVAGLASVLWAVMVGIAAAIAAAATGGIQESDSTPWTLACIGPLLVVLAVVVVAGLLWCIADAVRDLQNIADDERGER